MEQSAQTDAVILIFSLLSVLFGYSRGFCAEVTGLAIYFLSGVAGYYLIPVFQPAFMSFVPNEKIAHFAALTAGSVVSWIVLRILASSLIQTIKSSSLRRLDKSLGALFGTFRAGVLICLAALMAGFIAPHLLENSHVLKFSFLKVQPVVLQFLPDAENMKESVENDTELLKKKAVEYALKKMRAEEKDGGDGLFAALSEIVGQNMPADGDLPVSPEVIETLLRQMENPEAVEEKTEKPPVSTEELIRRLTEQLRELE